MSNTFIHGEYDISIIIPCFNRIHLLKETLKSVENAINEVTAEIILVDDGSEIPIEKQLPEFQHLPIKFIRQANSGLVASKYNGLMAASGTYVLFLDSDDQIAPDKLSIQVGEMRKANADVSHSDIQNWEYQPGEGKLTLINSTVINHSDNPAEFYLRVQPAPHSPVYLRDYLIKYLTDPFIKLNRQFDPIGEVWLYFNLCVFNAKIIKIDKPLTIIIEHGDQRLTNHWERLGLAALGIQIQFEKFAPESSPFYNESRKYAALSIFESFRRLPYNMNMTFQNVCLKLWKRLGGNTVIEAKGGKLFTLLAKILGLVNAAKIIRRLKTNNYNDIKTITDDELNSILKNIVTQLN